MKKPKFLLKWLPDFLKCPSHCGALLVFRPLSTICPVPGIGKRLFRALLRLSSFYHTTARPDLGYGVSSVRRRKRATTFLEPGSETGDLG